MENCFFPDFSGTHSWRRVCVYLFQGMNRSVEFHKIKYGSLVGFEPLFKCVYMVFMFMIPNLLKGSGSIANQKWLNWLLFDHWDPWGRWLWLIYSTHFVSWCLAIYWKPKIWKHHIYHIILFVGFNVFPKKHVHRATLRRRRRNCTAATWTRSTAWEWPHRRRTSVNIEGTAGQFSSAGWLFFAVVGLKGYNGYIRVI